MYGHWHDHNWMFGGGMFLSWIWMGMLLIIPLLVIFSLLKFIFRKNLEDPTGKEKTEIQTPIDILKTIYARGEISREEFLQKRNDILEK
jgi:putative membrane protein